MRHDLANLVLFLTLLIVGVEYITKKTAFSDSPFFLIDNFFSSVYNLTNKLNRLILILSSGVQL